MSVKIMGLVWDTDLKPTLRFVLLAYADHANHEGKSIYPSIRLVTEKTGFSKRTVQSSTRELEQMGYLIADGQGPRGTNKWRIPLDVGGVSTAPPTDGVNLTVNGDESPAPGGVNLDAAGDETDAPEPSIEPLIEIIKEPLRGPMPKNQSDWIKALTYIGNHKYKNRPLNTSNPFQKYWQPTEVQSEVNGKLEILCVGEDPEYQKEWLEDRGEGVAEKALIAVTGKRVEVEYVLEGENNE